MWPFSSEDNAEEEECDHEWVDDAEQYETEYTEAPYRRLQMDGEAPSLALKTSVMQVQECAKEDCDATRKETIEEKKYEIQFEEVESWESE